MSFLPKGWGEYPPEYDRKVHGFYNPSVYYGKRDTPFSQVKLGELGSWLGRRNKSPRAISQAISRAWWSYMLKWVHPLKPGPAYFYQICFGFSALFFLLDYSKIQGERRYRYH